MIDVEGEGVGEGVRGEHGGDLDGRAIFMILEDFKNIGTDTTLISENYH